MHRRNNRNFQKLPDDFDWQSYIRYNDDLRLAGINTEIMAQKHWLRHGVKENRIYKKTECILNNFDKYPYLFHKYNNGISDPNTPIDMKILNEHKLDKKLICHIHCYDLNQFIPYFGKYFETIHTVFDIIVTFSIIIIVNYPLNNFWMSIFSCSENKTMPLIFLPEIKLLQ